MIERNLLKYLELWKSKPHRKPLVLRGARQVGKSWLVREFARRNFKNLVEVNFERHPEDADLIVKSKGAAEALRLLAARAAQPITPGKTLVFLDEIQVKPELFSQLRYFYEEMPELHIISAGSLLDFTLSKAEFAIPVGRIEYCFMGPLTFSEFLAAKGRADYVGLMHEYKLGEHWPDSIHIDLLTELKTFWLVGGMPEAAAVFLNQNSLADAEEIKAGIAATYRDDFGKYGSRLNHEILRKVYHRAASLVGKRAKFVEYDRECSSAQIKQALNLLTLAQVLTRVRYSKARGLPLGAEAHQSLAKYLFLDIGLQNSICDFNALTINRTEDLLLVNRGSLAEQFIGQHLLRLRAPYLEPEIYYWERTERNASAEVDYVINLSGEVIPLEIKSGAPGKMKSLQLFMESRKCGKAIRYSTAKPIRERLSGGQTLFSLPLYFVEESERIIANGN